MSLGNIVGVGGSSDAERTFETVNQTAHGFSVLAAVYHNGTDWQLAQADDGDTVAQGIVTAVTDVDNFEVTTHGVVEITSHGLTVGEYYWLSDTVAGGLALTNATIAQSLVHVRDANTIFVDVEQAVQSSNFTTSPLEYGVFFSAITNPGAGGIIGNWVNVDSLNDITIVNNHLLLKANKKYRVDLYWRIAGAGGQGSNAYSIYDVTNGAVHGSPAIAASLNTGTNDSDRAHSTAIIQPTTDIEISAIQSGSLGEFEGTIVVQELPSSTIVTTFTEQYSTNETATDRKWIDGKVIYERVVQIPNGVSSSHQVLVNSAFETLVNVETRFGITGNSAIYYGGTYNGASAGPHIYIDGNGHLQAFTDSGTFSNDSFVIVRYTKV